MSVSPELKANFNECLVTAVAKPQSVTRRASGLPVLGQRLLALLGLVALCPLFLLLVIAIRLESKGAIIYSQIRVGGNGRRFQSYKFRSMYTKDDPRYTEPQVTESDREGVCKKYKKDPRITRVGSVIRKLSLDELPQLFNVLKGDMLLVGPRPALCCETDCYDEKAMRRLAVEAGMTGLWQVSGRADTTFEEQIDLDIEYIEKRSWLFDLKILVATIPAMLLAKGAY